jgi:hypothetical protein
MEAMVAINIMKAKKLKSTSAKAGDNQVNPPSFKTPFNNNQLMGTVIPNTKITAAPKPMAVFTFFDTAKYEHIPKKYAKIILSTKIDLTNMLTKSAAKNIMLRPPQIFG